jgi:hypothetical protein
MLDQDYLKKKLAQRASILRTWADLLESEDTDKERLLSTAEELELQAAFLRGYARHM